eukprot:6876063-Prymnesium_polylepis.2
MKSSADGPASSYFLRWYITRARRILVEAASSCCPPSRLGSAPIMCGSQPATLSCSWAGESAPVSSTTVASNCDHRRHSASRFSAPGSWPARVLA